MLNRILLTTDTVGGVWRYSIDLARGCAARGIKIMLAVVGPPPGAAQQQEAACIPGLSLLSTGLPLDWLAETPDEVEFAGQVLAAVARQVDADIVQLHAPALLGHARWPVPVVAVVHSCVGTWWQAVRGGPLPPELAWRAKAAEAGINDASVVVVPSHSFAAALRSCYGTERPIIVVQNGRSPAGASTTRQKQALTAGRLWDEGKNVATLDIVAGGLAWPVLAAGPLAGPNGAKVSCRHMHTLGSLDSEALSVEYARAAVFVSLARYEPFGLAALEAAQAGCALVLSDIPTFRELWDDAAVFVPSDAPDRVANALEDVLGHPETCASWGLRASRRAASFDVRRMIDATMAIHEELMSPNRVAT